jgi:hypothetical protein
MNLVGTEQQECTVYSAIVITHHAVCWSSRAEYHK